MYTPSASVIAFWTVIVASLVAFTFGRGLAFNVPRVRRRIGPFQLLRLPYKRHRPDYERPIAQTSDASHSGAFTVLPPEVRLLILQHAIGHRLLHLVETEHGIERRVCWHNNNVNAWYHPCWKVKRPGADPILSLLLVSRHIYSEAIEALYSSNTFHFLRPTDLVAFIESIPHSHANLIRSIKLYVNPATNHTDRVYTTVWPILSKLPILKELRLLIAPSVMTKESWMQRQASLLEPIRSFEKKLKVFDLFLSVFPDWIGPQYQETCHVRPIKQIEQITGAHLSKYS